MIPQPWPPGQLIGGALAGLLLCGASLPAMQHTPVVPVRYVVALPSPQTQMVEVAMTVPHVEGPSLEVALPVWRPGRYIVTDPAGTVRGVRALGVAGEALPVVKLDKSTWRIELDPMSSTAPDEVTVHYRVYANSLGDRTRHVDDTHAFLSGESVFMYAPSRRDDPVEVRVRAPDGWRVATGLERVADDPPTFVAPGYDVLADSPLEVGLHDRAEFTVRGVPHALVVWGEAEYDEARLVADLTKIVESQADLFGDLPYERYVFMLHVGAGASGGTEHLNSTIMQVPRSRLEDPKSYRRRFLGLVAHEMFHTWNVKQLRPAGLNPYDWQRENYTRLLWVAEGTTSYYDNLTLVRTGLISPDEYLEILGDDIDDYRRRPGRLVQSLEEASFDAWIKYTRPTPDTVNSTISFYSKGALVSLLLDLELRQRTDDRVDLDDVLRTLYERFPLSGPGYTPADFQSVVEELGGSSFDAFFEDYVRGTAELPLEEALGRAGLELRRAPDDGDESAGNGVLGTDADSVDSSGAPARAYLGLQTSTKEGRPVVSAVLSDGPAYLAGVLPGDELVALDGLRLEPEALEARLRALQPGQIVELTLFRYDRLRALRIELGSVPAASWEVRRAADASAERAALYESWLGRNWEGDESTGPIE